MSAPTRGRPRDEACGTAILSATIELVAEVGIAGLTVDAVASRAGVGKATIYRRWSSKEALMLEAWTSFIKPLVTPDTGALRSDLDEYFGAKDHPVSDDVLQRVYPQMIAASKVNAEVGVAYKAFIAERRVPLKTILQRAVERGELPPTSDLDLIHDLLIAPLLFRWLVSDGPSDETMVARNIDLVLAGATAAVHV